MAQAMLTNHMEMYLHSTETNGNDRDEWLFWSYSEISVNGVRVGCCQEMEMCHRCLCKSHYCEVVDPNNEGMNEYMTIGCGCHNAHLSDSDRVAMFIEFVSGFYNIDAMIASTVVDQEEIFV